jgi:hypothetical protein
MGEIQKTEKNCFLVRIHPDYFLDFAVYMFGFPRFFPKFGKSKQNKYAVLLLGFRRFYIWIFVWISPVLNILVDNIQTKNSFCLDFPDF